MKAGLVEFGWTLVFQIINTVILFLILRKLLFKPVSSFLAKRQEGIAASIKEAEDKNIEADELKKQYEESVANANNEAREIVKEASKRAEDRATDIIKEAQNEAVKIKERTEAEITREKQKALNSLKDEMASLAVLAAGKIIDKNLDENSHAQLVKDFIDEVGDAQWRN